MLFFFASVVPDRGLMNIKKPLRYLLTDSKISGLSKKRTTAPFSFHVIFIRRLQYFPRKLLNSSPAANGFFAGVLKYQ